MHRSSVILSLAIASAACSGPQPEKSAQAEPVAEDQLGHSRVMGPETIRPGEPGGLPDDRTPIAEGAIDPKSGQGAGQVLQTFGGLMERRKFGEAYRLWSDGGRASGLSQAQFAAAYDKYAEIHSEVGAPGEMQGAAGSAFVEIPFRLYGKLKSGDAFNLVGPVTLRRVNDVPGSTEEQRRWHIYKSALNARP